MCIRLKNNKEIKEVTINIPDAYLEEGHIFLDPETKDNGLLTLLKKLRIIKNISGMIYYNYISIPVAFLNMGILRQYDYNGVISYMDNRYDYGE